MVCEKCWSDAGGDSVKYGILVNARNMSGATCSPEQQCGDRHLIAPGASACRCGKRVAAQRTEGK
jgi:hypothetical protein